MWIHDLLARFRRRPVPLTETRLDSCLGDKTARELRLSLQSGRWDTVHQYLSSVPDVSDIYDEYVLACSAWDGRPNWLDAWAEAQPRSSLPFLIRGVHSIEWAWEARSGKWAEDVPEEAWPVFVERLGSAVQDLRHAITLSPNDPTSWRFLIVAQIGLDLPAAERLASFREATRRAPLHFGAHCALFMSLCEKWGGTHEEMFEFVHTTVRKAPRRHALHMLIPAAHAERWLYFAVDGQTRQQNGYFRGRGVRAELATAYELFKDAPLSPGSIRAANLFAFAFHRSGDRTSAREAFASTAGIITTVPWSYAGDPRESYRRALSAVF